MTCATASAMPIVRNANAVVAIATWKASSQPGPADRELARAFGERRLERGGDEQQQRRHAALARAQGHHDRGDAR